MAAPKKSYDRLAGLSAIVARACLPVDDGASVNAAPRVQALLRD